jgi:hypothetical protein
MLVVNITNGASTLGHSQQRILKGQGKKKREAQNTTDTMPLLLLLLAVASSKSKLDGTGSAPQPENVASLDEWPGTLLNWWSTHGKEKLEAEEYVVLSPHATVTRGTAPQTPADADGSAPLVYRPRMGVGNAPSTTNVAQGGGSAGYTIGGVDGVVGVVRVDMGRLVVLDKYFEVETIQRGGNKLANKQFATAYTVLGWNSRVDGAIILDATTGAAVLSPIKPGESSLAFNLIFDDFD